MKSKGLRDVDEFHEYEITDENHNQINEKELVEAFFLQKASAAEFNQAMVLIRLKNMHQKEINAAQEESNIIFGKFETLQYFYYLKA